MARSLASLGQRLPLCSMLLVAATASQAGADDTLSGRIESVVDAPEFKHASWGLLIADQDSGDTLYERHPDKLFVPASTTKLFSVAAALATLGADDRFETPVYALGKIDDQGRLDGDLVLVASGDLSLGGRTDAAGRITFRENDHIYASLDGKAELTEADPLAGLNDLARQVAAAGITRIGGDVLIDDRLFEPARGTGSGPSRLTPIMVNDNLIDFLISPAATAGSPAEVKWRPESSAYQVDPQVETVEAAGSTQIEVSSTDGRRFVVRGSIAVDRRPLVVVSEVADAAEFARSLLIEALRRAGVVVEASPLAAAGRERLPARDGYTGLHRVALLTSPPFAESAKLILKVSHNLHASTLPLLVAARHGERTLAAGLRRQREFLATAGVDVDSISFGGAAGGDRADYITPRAAVQLLRHMASRPDFAAYQAALPVLGIDGTLAGALADHSPARGKIQAKTGTLLWSNTMNGGYIVTSKALAGYATTAGGRRLAFAMFVNNVPIRESHETTRLGQVLGRLCEIMYESF